MKMNLKLEPLKLTHSEDLIPVWTDEDVIRYTNIQQSCTITEIEEKISLLRESEVFVVYHEGSLAGIIGCPSIDGKQQFGIFYHLCKKCWGKGIGFAAAERLLKYMDQKYGKTTILADVVSENMASIKILRRCGFELIIKENAIFKGKPTEIHHLMRKPIAG